ncbi:MAG: ABC-F family ATP-binding cassette domain-containing protein [Chitinophagaceae bacterium]|nr:ABC-F family ATP-binding cassette domain-containing protein [Chitinophagaceae bacterium]
MHYASLLNLTKSFGVRVLFKDISFHINEGDKIALIARNGSGKSTLLQIIAGLEEADSGTVWIHKDIRLVYLPQEHHFPATQSIREVMFGMDHETVRIVKAYEDFQESGGHDANQLDRLLAQMEDCNGWMFETQMQQILSKLNITDLTRTMGTLSGGQVKRVALAQALLQTVLYEGKCLLVMDEPTNHLDVKMVEWLEDYLSAQKVTLLMVTHDRYFLDSVCNDIIEIENNQVYRHSGNYSYFLEQKAHRNEVEQSELKKDKNIYRKELEWMRKQPRARTVKSKSRQDNFEVVQERVREKNVDSDVQLQVKMTRLGGKILEMKKVYKAFGEKVILKGFDYTFKRGERIGIVGPNGVGKSTFIKIALQQEEPDSGKINHGETVVFGHFSQDGLSYKEDKRIIEWVKDMAEYFPLADGTKLSASAFLERFAFTPEQQYTYLSKLSGGEKRRLQLLGILFKNPNFLVLDEPTNDLDLQTLQILEEFLLEFPGCLLLVSHDRYFMDKLVDHLLVFEGQGEIRDFPGNYSQFRMLAPAEWVDKKEAQNPPPPAPVVEKTEKPKAKLSFNEKRELEKIEQEMPRLQAEKIQLEADMSTGHLAYNELQAAADRIQVILHTLDEMELRWLELSEKTA